MFEEYRKKIRDYVFHTNSQLLKFNAIVLVGLIACTLVLVIESIMKYDSDGIITLAVTWAYLVIILVACNLYPKKVGLFSAVSVSFVNLHAFVCKRRGNKVGHARVAHAGADFALYADKRLVF